MAIENENNKRIAKNTMYLYIRMLFSLLVGLYTSRVVLQTLGISDYGLYNVVGGFVSIFMFINGTMTVGTQRFLSYEIGKGNIETQKSLFKCSNNSYLYCFNFDCFSRNFGFMVY